MTATMTTPTQSAAARNLGGAMPASIDHVRDAATAVVGLVAELEPAHPDWHVVGPMLADLARQLRRSLGARVRPDGSSPVAPVVHLRDLAVASRALLGRDATIVDTMAAGRVRELHRRIAVALA